MVKIFVVTHKPVPFIKNNFYTPIQVNASKNKLIYDHILTDNTFDNISHKNDNYCELTASYWITKNYKDTDIIGLCHYRRYFNLYKNPFSISPSSQKRISKNNIKKHRIFTTPIAKQDKLIEQLLNKYDVILPYRSIIKKNGKLLSVTKNFEMNHRKNDFDVTKEIILEKYPEYKASIVKYLDESSVFHAANMLITTAKHWREYHNWLFSILFELENRIDIPTDDYQKRVFGFISERLVSLYFYHNNFKIKELPLIKIE